MGTLSFKQGLESLWEVWFQSACTCHNTIQWFIRSYGPVFLFVSWFLFSWVGFSWSLELRSEAEFAETLLAGSLGLCLTMHNWALLLAYSHGCTLFSWNGQECKLPPHPPPPPSTSAGLPWRTSVRHKVYQTCLSERAGLAWAHIKRHSHKEVHTYKNTCITSGRGLRVLGSIQLQMNCFYIYSDMSHNFCIIFYWKTNRRMIMWL